MTALPAPLLLIVSGRAATGKTTLARKLADDLRLPLIYKDGLKESLFDSLGAGDRARSRRLGVASIRLQRALAAELLRAGVSHILESNFREEYDGEALRAIAREYRPRIAQLWLTCAPEALIARFERRAGSIERHPGHVELANMDEMRERLSQPGDTPIEIAGALLAMDTTDIDGDQYATALAFARMALDGAQTYHGSS